MARSTSTSRHRRLFPSTTPRVTSAPATSVSAASGIPTTTERASSRTTSQRLVPGGNGEHGTCRVVCYSPRHDLGFGDLSVEAIGEIVETWTEQYKELGADPHIGHVQIFENRGAQMGASNPHPHGQIWATEHVPTIVAREQEALERVPLSCSTTWTTNGNGSSRRTTTLSRSYRTGPCGLSKRSSSPAGECPPCSTSTTPNAPPSGRC